MLVTNNRKSSTNTTLKDTSQQKPLKFEHSCSFHIFEIDHPFHHFQNLLLISWKKLVMVKKNKRQNSLLFLHF